MPFPTDPREWVKKVRSKTPVLMEVGRQAPKAVLSFGGCGFLVTYSLGVALYLQQEKAELLAHSFLLGAGSGVIPAIALACGPRAVNIEKVRDAILDNRFMVTDEERRIEVMTKYINALLPRNAVELVSGRLALTIGFSNRDPGYMKQTKEQTHFGHHVAQWADVSDLGQCILASTAPSTSKPMIFRDADNVMRGTMMSLSSELDQYCRHVYIHGYCGCPYNKHQTRHNVYFGRHGFLANTHFSFWKQVLLAFAPTIGGAPRREELLEAYDAGYNDARRYERWEEDPYHFSKADRSPGGDFTFLQLRANLFGGKKAAKRFEL